MYPELRYQLMQAQVADRRAQAQRDALARATRRARRVAPTSVAARLPAAALTRRLRTVLGAGNQGRVAPRARRVRAGAHGLGAGEIYQVHERS